MIVVKMGEKFEVISTNHLTDQIVIDGEKTDVVSLDGKRLSPAALPDALRSALREGGVRVVGLEP